MNNNVRLGQHISWEGTLRGFKYALAASVSLWAFASAASAQSVPAEPPAAEQEAVEVGEIVVTARRQNESLQDVPQTVNAVSGQALEKLNILEFEDISSVVPGLTLEDGGSGYAYSASVRGVSFDTNSAASPTVEFYLNDAPIGANQIFQAMYDVGQIEILRGPQGTLRGRSAPSGAITLSTRKPDLTEFGGYVSTSASQLGARNVQGAVNLPILQDKLALRLAGVFDENEGDGVRSINSDIAPNSETKSWRASLRFEPTENLDFNLVYQHLGTDVARYNQVSGSGAPGGFIPGTTRPAPPAGYNGPVIDGLDRLSVYAGPSTIDQSFDTVTAQANWAFAGHKLSYVGSYSESALDLVYNIDEGNSVPGVGIFQNLSLRSDQTSHELRLSSAGSGRFLDYAVGAFYSRSNGQTRVVMPASYLDGVAGQPDQAPDPFAFDPRYRIDINVDGPSKGEEISYFGSLTAHLTESTELTVGARQINSKSNSGTRLTLGGGLVAVAIPAPCADIGFGSTYPGFCDVPVAPIGVTADYTEVRDDDAFIYNATLNHRFNRDLMVYANIGTSYRQGPTDTGPSNAQNDPLLRSFIFLEPEKSTAYEIGAKGALFDRRLRYNLALYRQNFDGLIVRTTPVPYLSDNGATQLVNIAAFNANADAIVDGIDFDATFQISPDWSIGGAVSYADGRIDNDQIPCRDSDFDGTPDLGDVSLGDFPPGTFIAVCESNASVSRAPLWSATLQSEYTRPLNDGMDLFVRGLFSYYPENDRQNEDFVVDSYGLLNLFAGIRSADGAWVLSVFVKNAAKNETILSREFNTVVPIGGLADRFGDNGYRLTTMTPRREVGVTLRWAFGSR